MFPGDVPESIRGYRVVRRLDSRRGGRVYLAREDGPLGFSRTVVLKLVADTAEGDADRAAELAREALICAKLHHPAIVRMHDFFQEAPWLVLVLEYVEGTSLARLIDHLATKKRTLPETAAFYVASCVTNALAHAHALTDESGAKTPVIHRDVSPSNVLLARDATVKLSGFGLGKILDRTPDTAIGVVKGTPGYMAPEQAAGERATEKVDVYGAGLLCWQLVTGRSPDPTLHGARLVEQMAGGDVDAIRKRLPRELVAAIEAALEPDPSAREITCAELAGWIAKIADVERGKKALRGCIDDMPLPDAGAIGTPAPAPTPLDDRTRPTPPVAVLRAEAETRRIAPARTSLTGPKAPRMGTLLGIGSMPKPTPAGEEVDEIELDELPSVSETQRAVSPKGPQVQETQRRVVPPSFSSGRMPSPAVSPPSSPSPSPSPSPPPEHSSAAPDVAPPPAAVEPPSGSIRSETEIARPPTAPPKPLDRPMPAPDAPKVELRVTPPPGMIEASADALRDTVISPRVRTGDHSAAIAAHRDDDVAMAMAAQRRRKGQLVVLGIVGAVAFVGLVGLVVSLAGRKSSSSEKEGSSTSSREPASTGAPIDATAKGNTKPSASSSNSNVVVNSGTAKASATKPPPTGAVPKGFGRLTVDAKTKAQVFIGDKSYGDIGDSLVVPCGWRWVFLGKADAKGRLEKRLSKSQSVFVKCGASPETHATIALK
jgi:serine/threonine protein kinase